MALLFTIYEHLPCELEKTELYIVLCGMNALVYVQSITLQKTLSKFIEDVTASVKVAGVIASFMLIHNLSMTSILDVDELAPRRAVLYAVSCLNCRRHLNSSLSTN
jgi:hypothetical protein